VTARALAQCNFFVRCQPTAYLHGQRTSASTRFFGIGIFEAKTTTDKFVGIIQFQSVQVEE
jgi:hypothetical protein